MSGKTVYLVRHGEADYNLLDRVNAHPHVRNNLTVTGREQAACCRAAFDGAAVEVIYCSEFPRAQQTAEIINERFRVPVVVDKLINETGAFAFEGKPARYWHAAQVPDRLSAAVPGCEPFGEMKARLATFLEQLRTTPARNIMVVSHEEPIQIMAGMLEGMSDAEARSKPISHCFPLVLQLS